VFDSIKSYIKTCVTCSRIPPRNLWATFALWKRLAMTLSPVCPKDRGNGMCDFLDRLSKRRIFAPCKATWQLKPLQESSSNTSSIILAYPRDSSQTKIRASLPKLGSPRSGQLNSAICALSSASTFTPCWVRKPHHWRHVVRLRFSLKQWLG